MVEIGGRPILWHIMKHYSYFSFNEFYIALGYKGDVIKHYFLDYYSLSSNMTVSLKSGKVEAFVIHQPAWPFNESTLERNVTHWPGAWLQRMQDDER